jgi:periplasmic divalent cation tolerance protein
MSGEGPCVQIQFALDDPVRADAIVATLLSEQLVACGQRTSPVISHYRWKGRLEQAEEWLVLLKTRAELAEQVIDVIVRDHPYEIPEVIVLPVIQGSTRYLDWITEVTADAVG